MKVKWQMITESWQLFNWTVKDFFWLSGQILHWSLSRERNSPFFIKSCHLLLLLVQLPCIECIWWVQLFFIPLLAESEVGTMLHWDILFHNFGSSYWKKVACHHLWPAIWPFCVCIWHHRVYCPPHGMVRVSRSRVVQARGWFRVPTLSPVCLGSLAFRSSFFLYCSALGKFILRSHGNVWHWFARGRGFTTPPDPSAPSTERTLSPFQVFVPLWGSKTVWRCQRPVRIGARPRSVTRSNI